MTWDRSGFTDFACYKITASWDAGIGALWLNTATIEGPTQRLSYDPSDFAPQFTSLFYHYPGDNAPFDANAALFHVEDGDDTGHRWVGEIGYGGTLHGGLSIPVYRIDSGADHIFTGETMVRVYNASRQMTARYRFPWTHYRLTHLLGNYPWGSQFDEWFGLCERPIGAPEQRYNYLFKAGMLVRFWKADELTGAGYMWAA